MRITYEQFELEVSNLAQPILDDMYKLLRYRFFDSRSQVIDRLNRNLFKVQNFKPHPGNRHTSGGNIKHLLFDQHLFSVFDHFVAYTRATNTANSGSSKTALSDKQLFEVLDNVYDMLSDQLSKCTFKGAVLVLEVCVDVHNKPTVKLDPDCACLKLSISSCPLEDNREQQLKTIRWVLSGFLNSILSSYSEGSPRNIEAKELVTNTILYLYHEHNLTNNEVEELLKGINITDAQVHKISLAVGYDLN